MEALKAIKPKYRNKRINSEVRRASQTHQAPHIGLPQNAPVQRDKKAIHAPIGASACAIMADKRVLKIKPSPAQAAITK